MKQFHFGYSSKETFRAELSHFKAWCDDHGVSQVAFQIYSIHLDTCKILEVCGVVEQEFPRAPYAGCSASGNILNGQFSPFDITVVATAFESSTSRVKFLQYEFSTESVEDVANDVIRLTNENHWIKALEMYITIPKVSTTSFCDSLKTLRPDVQVFGGTACSQDISSPESFVFSKGSDVSSDAVVFMMYGGEDFHVESMHVTGWQPLGRKFYITKAVGNVLYELDGKPAYDTYYKYLNIKNDENFFVNTLEFPLFYEHNGVTILRAPVQSNPDGSITMSSDMETGSITRIAYGNPCTILETVRTESKRVYEFTPDVIHIFSCAARRTFWNSDEEAIKELAPFKSMSPSSGFFTHGEFLRYRGSINQHNVTLVVAAMREGDKRSVERYNYVEEHDDMKRVPIVTRLATFIGVASAELEESNRKLTEVNYELEVLNHKLELTATFDGLTNLYNRSEIQKRIANCLAHVSEKQFSLIMLDIDNFKRVNDTYGHQVGDTVIIALANILRNNVEQYASGVFSGRWGGEEFMVLLTGLDALQSARIGEEIRKTFHSHRFPSATNQTVSIGVTQARVGEDLDTLCTRVDTALYKAKTTGKNKVVVV
jgi:diguanylate cyclase (GGDEF)-like protein